MEAFRFDPIDWPDDAKIARRRARDFLKAELQAGNFVSRLGSWSTFDAGFSRRAGAAGFIGMTWPKEVGGHELSSLARFAVAEEMLTAGAPCGAHWIADRQSGPQILAHGSERAKREILPRICRGECFFAIGMSEPDSGSDLAGVKTRAEKRGDGWVINGTKLWTTYAHHAHFIIVLVRTGEAGADRHGGLTQFIVDLSQAGVTVREIRDLSGGHEFNEVNFSDCFVPDDMMIGKEGEGWQMVTRELAFERSGPDRFLSDYQLLVELVDRVGMEPDARQAAEIGRLVAHLVSLRGMSMSVAGLLNQGISPAVEATVVKDVGTAFEKEIPEISRRISPIEPSVDSEDRFSDTLARVLLRAPSFTIRGGTREILRGVIARGMGLR